MMMFWKDGEVISKKVDMEKEANLCFEKRDMAVVNVSA